MKKDNHCPNCRWKYPLILPPGKRVDGVKFSCPECESNLVYHTGFGGNSKTIVAAITALSLPIILYIQRLDGNLSLQLKVASPLILLAIIALWYISKLEYVLIDENHDL